MPPLSIIEKNINLIINNNLVSPSLKWSHLDKIQAYLILLHFTGVFSSKLRQFIGSFSFYQWKKYNSWKAQMMASTS